MNYEDMKILNKAWKENFSDAWDIAYNPVDSVNERLHKQYTLAVVATLVDYLRGNIDGLPSPLSDLARSTSDSSHPNPQNPPADNGDPNPLATEVMKKLGSLGLQSLSELKGYKYDADNHVLLHINGRLADSGWLMGDPHMCELADIMSTTGQEFTILS